MRRSGNKAGPLRPSDLNNNYWSEAIFIYLLQYINKIESSYQKRAKIKNTCSLSQVQQIPNLSYQIYQTLQIY